MGNKIKLYYAPMEGITGYTYRNVHHACYPGMDAYFSPFLSPNQHHAINPKEKRDILPGNNQGVPLIPQVLTNKAEFLLATAKELKEIHGYPEVNLNLGCPSKTVVSKGKGSGFLTEPEQLERFFEEVFEEIEKTDGVCNRTKEERTGKSASVVKDMVYPRISVKTRLGMESPDEFARLLEIYNKYPLSELIIHPRVQKDFYKNTPNLEAFAGAVKESRHSLCYNGDIGTLEDYLRIRELFPTVEKIMIGRGLLANPELAMEIRAYEECVAEGKQWNGYTVSVDKIKKYHDLLFTKYMEQMSGDTNVLFKMKELWVYLAEQFPEEGRLIKKMKKANRLAEYEELAKELFC